MKRAIGILLPALFISNLIFAGDALHLSTVVIDAGHGGKDPGAVSADKKTYEKNIVLDISLRLADKIKSEYPDVTVVMTRDKDEFIPLNVRADIANKANADLFISIHVNAARNSSASGFSLHVMGQSENKGTDLYELNMESVMRENSVIQLEDDYSTSYEGFNPSDPESYIFLQLMQNAYLEQSLSFAQTVTKYLNGSVIGKNRGIWQNPFLVLWKTSMPSVLIEIGFISNYSDLSRMIVQTNREKIADCLYHAFKEYKSSYDRSLSSDIPPSATAEEIVSDIKYGVQIFAGKTAINSNSTAFMGYKPEVVTVGEIKKYVIAVGNSPSFPQSQLSTIRKKYPDAFIVKIESGTICPYKPEK